MTSSTFAFQPLGKGDIRLLSVKGISSTGIFECSLQTRHPADPIDYCALSYVCGDPATTNTIRCDGHDLPITKSVFEALTCLSAILIGTKVPIWIDALCINQADDTEKAREVRHMDDTYRRAKTVIVFLGPEAEHSAMAMECVRPCAESTAKVLEPPNPADLPKLGLPDRRDAAWPALGRLYRRPWFGRVWTFQEAVLATSIKVVCGNRSVDWGPFAQLGADLNRLSLFRLALMEQDVEDSEDGFRACANVTWAKFAKRKMGELLLANANASSGGQNHADDEATAERQGHIPFASLLMVSQNKLCTDPRDRVYGMLSLTSAEFRGDITVSYTRGLRDLYVEAGKACLRQDKTLTYLQLQAGRPKMPGLPSWCANLDSAPVDVLPFDTYLRAGVLDSDAMTAASLTGADIRTWPDRDAIELVGYKVDKVAHVIPPHPHPRTGTAISRAIRRRAWFARCLSLARTTLNIQDEDDEIPLPHIYAVSANTVDRVPDCEGLRQAYKDHDQNVASQDPLPSGGAAYVPPEERMQMFNDIQTQMFRACSGRAYLSTVGGRLGVGPPEMEEGDIIVVIPGSRPAFVLRDAPVSGAFSFVGDAFVHGLMELSRTPVEFLGREEVFRIV